MDMITRLSKVDLAADLVAATRYVHQCSIPSFWHFSDYHLSNMSCRGIKTLAFWGRDKRAVMLEQNPFRDLMLTDDIGD